MRRLSHLVAALLALLLALSAPALAEGGLCALSDYLDAFDADALGGGDWTEEAEGRILSFSPEKDAAIYLCAEDGRLLAVSVVAPQGEVRETCARLALPPAGWIDEAQLDAILADEKDATLDGVAITLLDGDLREGVYLCLAEELDDLCWQPLHGGEHRHRSPVCSGMDVPRLISVAAADLLELPPCENCMSGPTPRP